MCKKYGLKFRPILSCSSEDGEYCIVNKKIKVPILYLYFNEVLFHEVGHHLDYKLTGFKWKQESITKVSGSCLSYGYNPLKEVDYIEELYCEARASRYAMRLLKSANLDKSESFYELTGKNALASYMRFIPHDYLPYKITLADLDYRLCKYISGK